MNGGYSPYTLHVLDIHEPHSLNHFLEFVSTTAELEFQTSLHLLILKNNTINV